MLKKFKKIILVVSITALCVGLMAINASAKVVQFNTSLPRFGTHADLCYGNANTKTGAATVHLKSMGGDYTTMRTWLDTADGEEQASDAKSVLVGNSVNLRYYDSISFDQGVKARGRNATITHVRVAVRGEVDFY